MNGTLSRLWETTVGRSPTAVAVVDAASGRSWTRAGLAAGAALCSAAFLGQAGRTLLSGRRVAMSAPNGAAWLEAFLGLLSLGAIPAPIDPTEPEEAQLAVARSIGAPFLWREGRLCRVGALRRPKAHRGECLVKLTSGSSGIPKALAATHAQMAADGRQVCESMGIGPDDSNLAAIPFGYSYGLGNLVLPLIAQGTRIVCLSSVLPHAVAAEAEKFRPTVFPAVPPILRALAGSDVAARSLSSLRVVISAGSPLAPDVAAAFAGKFGVRVHGFYGTSETGGIAYDRTGDATLQGRSVGSPMIGVRISQGKDGRFKVLSPAVIGRGGFSPADRASLNGLGELVLHGRTDRVVKVAGRRLDLAEIEGALRSLPGVRDAFACVGGADAVLSAAAATTHTPAELRRLLLARMAPWKVPARIVAMKEFPSTARGKTDVERVRQALLAPRTATSISTFRAARQMSAPR